MRLAAFVLTASLLGVSSGALEASTKEKPVLIRDDAHPLDSLGDPIYAVRNDETKDAPEVSGNFVMMKPRKTPKPKYPASLRRAKQGSEVTVMAVVAPNGRVIDAEVDRGVAEDVRETTLDAINRYEITPATLNGSPIAMRIKIVVSYRIW